jgi:hypothetical protein
MGCPSFLPLVLIRLRLCPNFQNVALFRRCFFRVARKAQPFLGQAQPSYLVRRGNRALCFTPANPRRSIGFDREADYRVWEPLNYAKGSRPTPRPEGTGPWPNPICRKP